MRRAMRPEAVRAVKKLLLVDGLQHHRDRALQDLVLEGGNADGSRLRPAPLRDVDPPHRRRPVRARLRAFEKRLEIALQIAPRTPPRFAHPRPCTVLARASVRLAQPVEVDVMGKRRERLVGQLPSPALLSVRVSLRWLREPGVSPIFPSLGSDVPVPPFARRGPLGRFPRFFARTAALRLLVATIALVFSRSVVPPKLRRGRRDLPGSWGTLPYVPCFLRPRWAGSRRPGRVPCAFAIPVLPSALKTASATTTVPFGAQFTAHALAVYASRTPSPTPTQDSLLPADLRLGQSGLSPAGCSPKFQVAITFLSGQAFPGAPSAGSVGARKQSRNFATGGGRPKGVRRGGG